MHDRDHRQAGSRQPRQVAEDGAPMDKALDLVAQQIGAGALDQMHEGQLVVERDLLRPQDLLQAHGADRAGLDARVGCDHHAAGAGNPADAGDDAGARDAFRRVRVVHAETGQRRQLQVAGAGVEQQRDPLAGQQLAAFVEQWPGLRRAVTGAGFEFPYRAQHLRHVLAVAHEVVGLRLDAGVDDRHGAEALAESGGLGQDASLAGHWNMPRSLAAKRRKHSRA